VCDTELGGLDSVLADLGTICFWLAVPTILHITLKGELTHPHRSLPPCLLLRAHSGRGLVVRSRHRVLTSFTSGL
jgi:hypothetical protein